MAHPYRSSVAAASPDAPRTLAPRLSFVFASLAALALVACSPGSSQPQGPGGPGAGGAPQAMPVGVRTVQLQTVPVTLEAVGRAEGSKEVQVQARVSGLLERQVYQEGERVKAGAPMYYIERAPFEIALAQAKATLAQQAAQLEQARREEQRLKPLAEQQAISQREYDDATSALRLAEAAVAQAQAQVRQAELNLSYTVVHAPISGISGRSLQSEGSLVTPGVNGLLTTITQTDPIWVRFSFNENELSRLQSAREAKVSLLDSEGRLLMEGGRLNFAGSTVDPQTGTVQLRASFPNPQLKILPGQFVRAQVVAGETEAFTVPQSAVVQSEQGRMVWTIVDGKATPTPVELGGWSGSDWIVRQGLKPGDQVIIDNLMKLRPGAPVVAQGAAPAAPAASEPASAASE
ncbi:efflux RND transporter periplasmic adaptor subunit [Caldimonas thermodepolymerans]|jgi:RND family efflux transporter, MFP subunit|uniref:Efflux transporter periplasmic adaptor subunit n=1 Tax=Caldimonas thermodepolymerans TaxID=215580 RepID=A0A2S5T7R4_9BURK|nr:efflux RND transporter periplasmic adaptor subunit [Caldimonas thermodepolymerans]PPE71009.1 efflux transporter periplasmic adaptor subunit [Caldimonas thermodepolymerans]QPC31308.1 efflux RND transporter periplasmic adaptor subunit [Caldimonas thermodepolymerans]RDH99727.1 membrane fusion protein (multidrug efflux system) [Caldimonas thermodepolymerans]TCP07547.1 membrane fusion protein (multidrug efflux system) [Caldimonas thermodepolymerans]UZG44053.1 efflux RND transporter periplasmic a